MASMFLVSYTGMLSKAIGANWQHHGPLGKVERLIFIMIFSILEYLQLTGKISKFYSFTYLEWTMIIFVVLGQVTVFNRLVAQLKECRKLDWLKYRNLDKKTIVIYDSQTGNTLKAAQEAANALECELINVKDAYEKNISDYDLVFFAIPHLGRKITTQNTKDFLETPYNTGKPSEQISSALFINSIFCSKVLLNPKPVSIIIFSLESWFSALKGILLIKKR